jgi:hypothetical protein
MSKIKAPTEKKRVSLARDRRNTYGESPHAARKSIPKRKAIQHQQERLAANQALAKVLTSANIDAIETVQSEVGSQSRLKRLSGFKKFPDEPLGVVIKRKQAWRVSQAGRRKRSKNS